VLVFFDADVCVKPDVLRRFDGYFKAHPDVTAVIGSYDRRPADPHFVSQFKNLLHHYIHHHSRPDASTFWAACGAIRRQAFADVGGFDESYGRPSIEDIELGSRLRARGDRIALDPAIQVTHLKRWTLGSLLRTDLFDRAIPWLQLMQRDRHMPADLNTAPAHRLSVILVGTLVALLVLAIFAGVPHWHLLAVVLGVALLLLNADLYSFFVRQRGLWFATGAVILHWTYYANCGLAVVLTIGVHLRQRICQWLPRRKTALTE
jgi:hypothetical protein